MRSTLARLFLLLALLAPAHPGARVSAAASAAASADAPAAAIQVDTTLDSIDADPSDGVCRAADGGCSLRAAIMQANFTSAADTIRLPAGVFLLTRPGADQAALVGDLDVSADLTIQGAGAGLTIIDGNGAITGDRVFELQAGARSVALHGLTIRNGGALSSGDGGAIYRDGGDALSGSGLRLQDVHMEHNQATTGGGLFVRGGSLELYRARLYGNTAQGSGGGIKVDEVNRLHIEDTQVYSNTAFNGGGLSLSGVYEGLIERTQVYSNTAQAGGGGLIVTRGLLAPQPLVVSRSWLHHNQAFHGGGIFASTGLTIIYSWLENNTAREWGGGVIASGVPDVRTIHITHSTLSHNQAKSGGGVYYAEEQNRSGRLRIHTSTLSGNGATQEGAGLFVGGDGQAWVQNATVVDNRLYRRLTQTTPVWGGGLMLKVTAVLSIENTILARNVIDNGLTQPEDNNCYGFPHSLGHNLLGNTPSNCVFTGPATGDITGKDPLLEPLANYGGLTPTHALQPGSPAIEAGADAICTGTSDQRGVTRPANGDNFGAAVCDIGAYEYATSHSQAIDFPAIPDYALPQGHTLPYNGLVISATASSGLPVLFSAEPGSQCSPGSNDVFAGVTYATLTLLGPGTCSLTALQPGSSTFTAATPVTRTFQITSIPDVVVERRSYLPVIQR